MEKSTQPKPIQAQNIKPIPFQFMPSQQSSPTNTLLNDEDGAREEKRRGKQIVTSCTTPRGPGMYNSFSALGSLEEEG